MTAQKSGRSRTGRPKIIPKSGARPNLPQHNFTAPLAQLMTLGPEDFPEVYDEVAATLKQKDPVAGAHRLLEMIQDESFYDYDGDEYPGGAGGDVRGWTRLHALRW